MAVEPMSPAASQRPSEVGDVGFKSCSSQSTVMCCIPCLYPCLPLVPPTLTAKKEKSLKAVFELMTTPRPPAPQLFFSVFTSIFFTLVEILENHEFLLIVKGSLFCFVLFWRCLVPETYERGHLFICRIVYIWEQYRRAWKQLFHEH